MRDISALRTGVIDGAIITTLSVLSLFLINPFLSFDAWQYLSSAKALPDRDGMAQHYFWLREPGIPFIIKIVTNDGARIWNFFIFQAAIYGLSFWYAFRALWGPQYFVYRYVILLFNFFLTSSLLGGYMGTVGKEILTISLVLVFSALLMKIIDERLRETVPYRKVLAIALITILAIPISKPLTIAFIFALFLMTLFQYWSMRKCPVKGLFAGNLMLLSISVILGIYILLSKLWNNEIETALQNPKFNKSNLDNILWSFSASDYFSRLTSDVTLLQSIPTALLSIVGLGVNLGWIIDRDSVIISPSQNADIGFGLLSTQYPRCNSSFPHGVVADSQYLSVEASSSLCGFTSLNVPWPVFYLIYLIWILVFIVFLFNLFGSWLLLRQARFIAFLTPALTLVFLYAIAGGAIDRYGTPLISVVVMMFCVSLYSRFSKVIKGNL